MMAYRWCDEEGPEKESDEPEVLPEQLIEDLFKRFHD